MKRRLLVIAFGLLVVTLFVAPDASACWYCRYSPHNYGFCRGGLYRGWGDCYEYVADAWTGRTACDLRDNMCGAYPDPLSVAPDLDWVGASVADRTAY
jgi:hypothetical protein